MGKGFNHDSLVIFVKNPLLGKVKSRLAKSVGDAQALAIYLKLLQHTRSETDKLPCTKSIYYSDYIDTEDDWDNEIFNKDLQNGNDLGERMNSAFDQEFSNGYKAVCIIGSDNPEITGSIIKDAFNLLGSKDVVLGPATDGGYYLIGLKKPFPELFLKKRWSTSNVLNEALETVKQHRATFALLPELTDIDTEIDLNKFNPDIEWKPF